MLRLILREMLRQMLTIVQTRLLRSMLRQMRTFMLTVMLTWLPTQMLRLLPTDLLHSVHRQCAAGAITFKLGARIRGRLCVAGRRVNLLLASSGCAPHCTRRPAPGVLLLGFRARRNFSRQKVDSNQKDFDRLFAHSAWVRFQSAKFCFHSQ